MQPAPSHIHMHWLLFLLIQSILSFPRHLLS